MAKKTTDIMMKRYELTLTGLTPLILHSMNFRFAEKIAEWRKAPENKEFKKPGDDRSPAWTWIGCLYTDGRNLTMSSDCLATCLREAAKKVPTGNTRGDKSYKKLAQSGIQFDTTEFDLLVNGKSIPLKPINDLIGEMDYAAHEEVAFDYGFELFAKAVRVQQARHIRVRPMFRNWVVKGTITVLDEEMFGLKPEILRTIWDQAGAFCGLGDWRPSAQTAPGPYGRFSAELKPIPLA